MQAARTGDERYCNWVKDTMALLYLKEGLEVFVEQQSNAFHNLLKAAMGAHTCTCTWQALARGKRTWEVKHCPSGTCRSWLGLILSHHRNRPFPQLTPENTDPGLWPKDYWEVMKVYQPRGCRDQHSAKEADVAGILTTLNNCDHFWPFITNLNDIDDLFQLRNRLMHSSDFLVETPDMSNDLQLMLQFLRGLKSLSPAEHQHVQTAIDKIDQLRANKLDLSLNRELELKTIRAKQAALEYEVGAHKTDLQTHQKELGIHTTELQTHHREFQIQKSDLKAHRGELQTHQKELQTHTCELQTHQKELNTHTSELQTHHGELQKQQRELQTHRGELQAYHGELVAHRTELEDHDKRLSTCQTELKSHNSELVTHKNELQTHQKELQTHNNELQTHQKEFQTIDNELQAHNSELQTHKKELQTHHGKLQTHRSELEDHDERLSTCQTELKSLNSEQVKQQSQLQVHGAKLEDQDTRLLSCQTELQVQKEDLRGHHKKLTNLEERMENPKADTTSTEITEADVVDLRTSLIQHYRQHCLKVPNPVIAEEIGMNEIYVRPDIKVLRETKNSASGLVNVQNRKSQKNASICKKLFYTDDYKNKQIYVTSDAGMGKTLFCKHLTNMWCCAHTDACSGYPEEVFFSEIDFCNLEDIEEEIGHFDSVFSQMELSDESCEWKQSRNEDNCTILLDFTFLFYLTLRDSMKQYSIAEMIDKQILRHIKSKKRLKASDILENEGCLVIIDGLDEWACPEDADVPLFVHPGIPGRLGFNSNNVCLITTRPWKFDVLNLTSSDVDKHVELVGLNKGSSKRLCSKLSKLFSGCEGVNIVWKKIWTELKKKGLTHLHTIPVLFTQLICLWFDKQELGQSQVQLYCSMLEMLLKRPDKNLRNRKPPVLPKPDVAPTVLPESFSNHPYCQAHQHLLLSLCRVAFEALFNEKREDSLVLDSSQGELLGLDAQSVELCLSSGILSQNKVLGKWSVSQKKMSFLHKKVQEFLAAVFITINDNPERVISRVTSFCCTVDTLLEMSQVWMFVSGLRPDISRRLLTDTLPYIVNNDKRIQQYRQRNDHAWVVGRLTYERYKGTRIQHYIRYKSVEPLVVQIQTCIIECVTEARNNGYPDFCLPLEDLVIQHTNYEYLENILTSNIEAVKSFVVEKDDVVPFQLTQLTAANCLQKLSLPPILLTSLRLLETIDKYDSLTCLDIDGMSLTSELSAAVCDKVKNLTALCLSNIKLAHKDREQLALSLSHARALRQLLLGLECIGDCSNCNAVPDLSSHTQLRSLLLQNAYIDILLVPNCVEDIYLCDITVPRDQLWQCLHDLSATSNNVMVELSQVFVTGYGGFLLPNFCGEVNTVLTEWGSWLSQTKYSQNFDKSTEFNFDFELETVGAPEPGHNLCHRVLRKRTIHSHDCENIWVPNKR